MNKNIITIYLLTGISICCWSQKSLEGRIKDKLTGEAVPYAFLTVGKGLSGTVSNLDGYYKINTTNLADTDSIVVSHISYNTARLSIQDAMESSGEIFLNESETALREVEVQATEDDALLAEIRQQSKKDLNLPVTVKAYYREWVKGSSSYNRFSDGVLTINYPTDKDDLKIKIDQSRAFHLPKDEDEMFDSASPLKMESVLNNGYIDFLNKFLGDRKVDYHFYEYRGQTTDDFYTIIVEPKKNVKVEEDKFYFRAVIKADQYKDLKEVSLDVDSITNYAVSFLGLKIKVLAGKLTFSFRKDNGRNYLCFARVTYNLKFTVRKTDQVDQYTSEFLLMEINNGLMDIARKDAYTKKTLYKNGNKYYNDFWRAIEMPLLSEEEQKLLLELEQKSNAIKK
jgi:hypothetical protein